MSRFVQTGLALLGTMVAGLAGPAAAQEWLHATSLGGEPKYPAGFAHFDYVNPSAPNGGVARLSAVSTSFDTLNPILPQGVGAAGLGLIYETLMTSSLDEQDISAQYGLIAEAVRFPDDYSWAEYRLNPAARWHDGEPITAEDVVWSFEKAIEISPNYERYYSYVTSAEVVDDGVVRFTFDEAGNRELPHILGEIIVLPKHWWEGTGPDGNPRDIGAGTLEPTLGSGPYRIAEVVPGRSISYERVGDYWGAGVNVNVGQNNFDEVRYEYYRDGAVKFEAFKAGEFDFWAENEAQRWANSYDFAAFNDGRVKRELLEFERDFGVMVGMVMNLRRPLFQDIRVRRALNYAFDFEELNRTMFFDQYERINSYFYGEALGWRGLPEGKELEILETVRDKIPPEVFTTEHTNPVGGDPESQRENLRKALELFQEAGFRLEGNTLLDPEGRPVTFEMLMTSTAPIAERVAIPYQNWLRRIGIDAAVRSVDSTQLNERVRSRDFDMVYTGWTQSSSPGNEQLDFWGSKAADIESSRNYAGIKDPAVDALIERVIFASDREDLLAATAALDRVLVWNQYLIPSYTLLAERVAYWDRFGHPPYESMRFSPGATVGFPSLWWWDADKAAAVGG